jgi:hypothetical protein
MKSDQSNQTKPSSKDSEIEEVNQLDNDKDLRQEILYEFLNQFKEDKYLSQGNTDKAVGAIDQYTQSKLKAFAGEVTKELKLTDQDGELHYSHVCPPDNVGCAKYAQRCQTRNWQMEALKAIKGKYQL